MRRKRGGKAEPRRRERPDSETRRSLRKEGGALTVALAYPNTYKVGMASLGFQTVFRGLGNLDDVLCLRAFLPDDPSDRPPLLTCDHPRPVGDSDWVAFSVSFENDYPNILEILERSGVPPESAERGGRHPLVVIGGIAASLNPEPLAAFADVIVIGESEEVLGALVECYLGAPDPRGDREGLLLSMARIPGVYVPRFYRPSYRADGVLESFEPTADVPPRVKRLWVERLDDFHPDAPIACSEAEFSDMLLVETGRGCGRGCRFCAGGHFYRPLRFRGLEALKAAIGSRRGAAGRVGLLGASVSDHPDLEALSAFLEEIGQPFSLSSMRADAVRPAVLERMAAGGLKTVTIAPETGTQRLRDVIGKRLTDEEIFEAAVKITAAGVPNLKLYFMLGLPGETHEDVEGIVTLVKRIRHYVLSEARARGRMGRILVSASSFVPKPWTPFQWHPMEEVKALAEKQRFLKGRLGRVPNVSFSHDVPRWAFVQALLSRGDRRLALPLALARRHGGDWKEALRHSPVNAEFYVYRPRGYKERFPWDFIDSGIEKGYLWKEYVESLAGIAHPNA